MRSLKLLTILCAIFLSSAGYAEEENAVPPVTPIKELKNDAIDFENLPKESVIGSLAECVTDSESLLDLLTDRVKRKPMLYPYSEGLAYVNGILCHVGDYPRSIIYTVLEGPQYGLQTVMSYSGYVMYVNYDFDLEYTPFGIIFHHYYSDSEIITGSTQVISFY